MKIKVTRIFRWLQERKTRTNLLVGGAGSSKSYSTVQHIIFNILLKQRDKRILIIRKTRTSIRVSTWTLFNDLLREYGIPYRENKSLMLITVGSNQVLFAG